MAAKQINPLLAKTEQGIEAKIPPEKKQAYTRIVIAGMKVMFSEETHKMIAEQFKGSDDVVKNVSEGISNLMAILYKESKEKMPLDAAIPASIVLMTKALDFMERTMGVEINPDMLAQVSQATAEAVLLKFGITKEMVQDAVKQSQSGQQPGAQPDVQSDAPTEPQQPPQSGGLMNAAGA